MVPSIRVWSQCYNCPTFRQHKFCIAIAIGSAAAAAAAAAAATAAATAAAAAAASGVSCNQFSFLATLFTTLFTTHFLNNQQRCSPQKGSAIRVGSAWDGRTSQLCTVEVDLKLTVPFLVV